MDRGIVRTTSYAIYLPILVVILVLISAYSFVMHCKPPFRSQDASRLLQFGSEDSCLLFRIPTDPTFIGDILSVGLQYRGLSERLQELYPTDPGPLFLAF